MARPTRTSLTSGIAAWDSDVDLNLSLLFDVPFAMYQVDDAGDLPAASSYSHCLALVGTELYFSDGSSWGPYLKEAAYVADSTATTILEAVTDLNELLGALRTSGIMAAS